jgi:hypothetical protein
MFKLFGSMLAIVVLLLVLVSGWQPLASVKDMVRESSGDDAIEALRQQRIKDYDRARDVKRDAERWKAIKESLKPDQIKETLKALIPHERAKPDGCRQQLAASAILADGSGPLIFVGTSGQIDMGPASTCVDSRK